MHMANDFGMIDSKAGAGNKPFSVLSLADNSSIMTTIDNDDSYEDLFVKQLQIHYRTGDKLVAISASGNSPNIIAAAEWVKKHKGKVIGLAGFDGGRLKDICDILILTKAPKGEYG